MATGRPSRVTVKAQLASAPASASETRRPSTVGAVGRRRQRAASAREPSTVRSSASVYGLSPTREVGEHAVGARVGQRDAGPTSVPSARWVGCRCWKPVMSRRTTMKCMRLVCSTSKSRTVCAAAVDDPERQLEAPARRRGPPRELEREAVVADRQAAHRHRSPSVHRRPCRAGFSLPRARDGRRAGCRRTRRRRTRAPARRRSRRASRAGSRGHRVVAGLVDGGDQRRVVERRRRCGRAWCRGRR